jgi:hypothetical protein
MAAPGRKRPAGQGPNVWARLKATFVGRFFLFFLFFLREISWGGD